MRVCVCVCVCVYVCVYRLTQLRKMTGIFVCNSATLSRSQGELCDVKHSQLPLPAQRRSFSNALN